MRCTVLIDRLQLSTWPDIYPVNSKANVALDSKARYIDPYMVVPLKVLLEYLLDNSND